MSDTTERKNRYSWMGTFIGWITAVVAVIWFIHWSANKTETGEWFSSTSTEDSTIASTLNYTPLVESPWESHPTDEQRVPESKTTSLQKPTVRFETYRFRVNWAGSEDLPVTIREFGSAGNLLYTHELGPGGHFVSVVSYRKRAYIEFESGPGNTFTITRR